MTKKKVKFRISRKAKLRMILFFMMFSLFTLYLSYNLFSNINKIAKISEEKQMLNAKMNKLNDEEEKLNLDIKKLEDPDYVARYAREKYLYSKNGEIIIRIPDVD